MDTISLSKPAASFPSNAFKIDPKAYRKLTKSEISILVQNQNHAADWNTIFIREPFDLSCIRSTTFMGTVYLGSFQSGFLEYNGLPHPIGIFNSTLISCAVGANVSIQSVKLLANYQIEEACILFNIDELSASAETGFGNGFLRPGQNSGRPR